MKIELKQLKTSNVRLCAVITVAPTKKIHKESLQRISTISVVSASWMLGFETKTSGDFFLRAQKQFPEIRVSIFHVVSAIKIRDQNPQQFQAKNFKN